jgi:hypothetical protein
MLWGAAVLKFIVTGLAGTFLGLAATQTLLDERTAFGGIEIGPWRVAPKTGSAEIDPYSRAQFARTGEIAIAHAEGLSFLALTDSDGARLASRCTYELRGPVPDSRFWTLTLVSPKGLLAENAAGRYGFASTEVLRAADGTFAITVGRGARPGNWLPAPQTETFDLVLRLYDTLLDFSTSKVDQGALPRITKVACE